MSDSMHAVEAHIRDGNDVGADGSSTPVGGDPTVQPSSTEMIASATASVDNNNIEGTSIQIQSTISTDLRGSAFGPISSAGISSSGSLTTSHASANGSALVLSTSVPSFPPSSNIPATATVTLAPITTAVTPSTSPSHHGLSQSSKIAAIVVPIAVFLVLLPACVFCFIIRRNRRRHRSLRSTVEMKNVSSSSYEVPPHQRTVDRALPSLPPQQFAATTTSHSIPRRPLGRNSAYYTGIGQEASENDHPLSDTRSVTTAPPAYTNPNSPGLTEQNLLTHTVYGDRPPPGERTRSPFEDEDVVSDVSHTGDGGKRSRDVDEESVVSALDEGAAEKKGGGARHDDDNESVVSALDDEQHAGSTSKSHLPAKDMGERSLHLD